MANGTIILSSKIEKVTDGVIGKKVNTDLSSYGIELNKVGKWSIPGEKRKKKTKKSQPSQKAKTKVIQNLADTATLMIT